MQIFAKEGAKVVGVARTQATLDETLGLVKKAGGEGLVVSADLSAEEGAQRAVKATIDAYGRVDILINAAGVGWSWGEKSPGAMDPIDTTPPDKWREVMSINLDSVYYMCRLVVPHMRKQKKGSIVSISSVAGFMGLPNAHTYTATKGAILNLMRSIGITYGIEGIRANALAPGYIDTPMIAPVMGLFDDKEVANVLCPMERAGQPDEMAYGCLYLASDEASYTNGSVLVIDGGTSARM
jgi:NAD(P)-dependent dehydrogenase (short-subunit alcohol dehydrogenase family)